LLPCIIIIIGLSFFAPEHRRRHCFLPFLLPFVVIILVVAFGHIFFFIAAQLL